MRDRALAFLFVLLSAGVAQAQAVWQPPPPPLVTAENETWYRSGGPIEWNGDFYYPAGAPRAFDAYAMVRAGSYRGIPLYTDATLEPYSIVFVPISGARMQPYERPRTGMLADTTGSYTPSFPPQTSASLSVTNAGFVAQAPMPPTFARPYDLAPAAAPAPSPVTIVSSATPAPVGTSGRAVAVTNRTPTTAKAPTGLNAVWLEYEGHRWISRVPKAIERTQDLQQIGTYRGFPVYARGDDRSVIYVPSSGDLVVPYTRR